MPNLPSYATSPVVEVAAGVQFEKIEWLIAPRIGEVWEKFKHEFPSVEQHAPLAPVVEKLGLRRPVQQRLNVSVENSAITPRAWMLNSQGSELIQSHQRCQS